MPPITIYSYNANRSANQNLKDNFLATRMQQNRWGCKFKKLFLKHREHVITEPLDAGRYEFTAGMRAVIDYDWQSSLDELQSFRDDFRENITAKDDNGVLGLDAVIENSYMAVEIKKANSFTLIPKVELVGLRFCLALNIDSGDGRRVSWFKSSGVNDGIYSTIKPNNGDGVVLYDAYGNVYNGALKDGTKQSNILDIYGVEDRGDEHFLSNQDDRFSVFLDKLEEIVVDSVKQFSKFDETTDKNSIVIGVKQFLNWLDKKIELIESGVDSDEARVNDDLELIKHLDMEDDLREQIGDNVGDIEHIYYRFYKKIETHYKTDDQGKQVVDEDYKWWEEEQFNDRVVTDDDGKEHKIPGINSIIKNWRDFVIVKWASTIGEQSYITLKDEIFELPGWKIYYLCRNLLDVDVDVEEPGFFEMLLNFFIAGIAIFFTWMSGMPVWVNLLVSANIALSAMGVNIPALQLITAVVTLGYSLYSTNWSMLSGMQMFKAAIKNIDMIMKVVESYKAIGLQEKLEAQAKEIAREKSLAQIQDEAMTYIYEGAYSQYDEFYEMMYRV